MLYGEHLPPTCLKPYIRCYWTMEKERIGVTPKQLCRNIRFMNVYKNIETSPYIDLADVALSCGYYDQAHLINEFEHFTETSPTEYFKTSSYGPDFFTANF